MFVLIRTFKNVHSMEEAARRAQSGIGEIVKRIPSFGGYFVFDAGQGVGGSITFFETKEAAIEAGDLSLAWIRASLADQVQGDPDIIVGEIIASVKACPESRRKNLQLSHWFAEEAELFALWVLICSTRRPGVHIRPETGRPRRSTQRQTQRLPSGPALLSARRARR